MRMSRLGRFQLATVYGRSGKMPIREPTAKSFPLEHQVRRTLREYDMLAPGDHVLVAVSGGADSTALLWCLHKLAPDLGISLTVAHLNHRIRGLEGDADEAFVRNMSSELGLPFVSEIIEVKHQAAAAKQNLEELARRIRYDFLRRTALQIPAQKIAVGHNLNDQAETALFRFIRGSGPKGLSAIHPVVDGLIIRPLLECSRKSIIEYLKRRNVRYREDSTNIDPRHARNKIRLELLPYLEDNFNPQLVAVVAREASLARETWSFIESQAEETFQRLHSRLEDGISLEIKAFLKLHTALQKEVLRQALKACLGSLRGISSIHIRSLLYLCKSAQSGDRIHIPHGSLAVRQSDLLVLLKRKPHSSPEFGYQLSVPGQCFVTESRTMFQCSICSAPDLNTMRSVRFTRAYLEPSVLPNALTIRARLPGDRYGGAGHRKVKKMLINSKIPRLQRSVLPILVAGDSVIWIPGFRPARGYEAQPESPSCVAIEMLRDTA
jgi:tRNA(Ile)-lysidine synthase